MLWLNESILEFLHGDRFERNVQCGHTLEFNKVTWILVSWFSTVWTQLLTLIVDVLGPPLCITWALSGGQDIFNGVHPSIYPYITVLQIGFHWQTKPICIQMVCTLMYICIQTRSLDTTHWGTYNSTTFVSYWNRRCEMPLRSSCVYLRHLSSPLNAVDDSQCN